MFESSFNSPAPHQQTVEPVGSTPIIEAGIDRADKLKFITFKAYQHKLQNLWNLFGQQSLEPILIKGWAAAINYPQPYLRPIGDFDLAVNPADLGRAQAATVNQRPGDIDWHSGLRHLDTVKWENLFENSILAKCGDENVRILRPEDHLRVLCVHWLGDGGRDREKLWDIYYAVKNRPPNFDWNRCLDTVSKKRRKWIVCTVGLTHRYLKLDIADTPLAREAQKLPGWLTTAVEREWNNPVEYRYLQSCLNDRQELLKQIKKRFPPNPIQATIEMNGDFESSIRAHYQIGNVFRRAMPSIKRIFRLKAFGK